MYTWHQLVILRREIQTRFQLKLIYDPRVRSPEFDVMFFFCQSLLASSSSQQLEIQSLVRNLLDQFHCPTGNHSSSPPLLSIGERKNDLISAHPDHYSSRIITSTSKLKTQLSCLDKETKGKDSCQFLKLEYPMVEDKGGRSHAHSSSYHGLRMEWPSSPLVEDTPKTVSAKSHHVTNLYSPSKPNAFSASTATADAKDLLSKTHKNRNGHQTNTKPYLKLIVSQSHFNQPEKESLSFRSCLSLTSTSTLIPKTIEPTLPKSFPFYCVKSKTRGRNRQCCQPLAHGIDFHCQNKSHELQRQELMYPIPTHMLGSWVSHDSNFSSTTEVGVPSKALTAPSPVYEMRSGRGPAHPDSLTRDQHLDPIPLSQNKQATATNRHQSSSTVSAQQQIIVSDICNYFTQCLSVQRLYFTLTAQKKQEAKGEQENQQSGLGFSCSLDALNPFLTLLQDKSVVANLPKKTCFIIKDPSRFQDVSFCDALLFPKKSRDSFGVELSSSAEKTKESTTQRDDGFMRVEFENLTIFAGPKRGILADRPRGTGMPFAEAGPQRLTPRLQHEEWAGSRSALPITTSSSPRSAVRTRQEQEQAHRHHDKFIGKAAAAAQGQSGRTSVHTGGRDRFTQIRRSQGTPTSSCSVNRDLSRLNSHTKQNVVVKARAMTTRQKITFIAYWNPEWDLPTLLHALKQSHKKIESLESNQNFHT